MWLWSYLEIEALILGGIWVACGLAYLLYMTKFFRKPLPEFHFDEEIIPQEAEDMNEKILSQKVEDF